jgi:2-oxoglutarate dehydrogenase E2 component (dihydrolipoamide succinyltransferase)
MKMATDIVVPVLGESVTEATVAKWFKKIGEAVELDEPVVELETDKVTLEVGAPVAGVLANITAEEGADVEVGAVLGAVDADGKATVTSSSGTEAEKAPAPEPASEPAEAPAANQDAAPAAGDSGPAVRKLIEENNLDAAAIAGTGKDGRLTKGDVIAHLEASKGSAAAPAAAAAPAPAPAPAPTPAPAAPRAPGAREERVKMSRLRQRIAERLKEAQNTAAMLTTFNEIDMTNVMASRSGHKDAFAKKHGVKLGFMSYFVKACVVALKEVPAVNAEIDGDEIVYKNHYDIGVAVGTGSGLVVPVVRDCDAKSFAEIEGSIAELGSRAQEGKLAIDDLTGGTFSITNGGIFGNLLSTPILNPPQSGILGMHKIQDRPMAINGEVVIRPMMYIALSYDHRIIDGREAVTFLKRIKECVEEPERILLDM